MNSASALSRNFKLIQVIGAGQVVCDPVWLERIERECEKILVSGHKFAQNYTPKNLRLKDHQSFDLLALDEKIVTWAGLFNGGRYPEGVFRIMNRLYINPEFRSHSCAYIPYARQWILPAQIARYKNEIKELFLSREGLNAKYFLKRWVLYNAPDRDWVLSKTLVQVAPAQDASCYQYVARRTFSPSQWFPKEMDESQWNLLPKGQ